MSGKGIAGKNEQAALRCLHRNERFRELWHDGVPAGEIVEALSLTSLHTAWVLAGRLGLPSRPRAPRPDHFALYEQYREEIEYAISVGHSLDDIAHDIPGATSSGIWNYIKGRHDGS